MQFVKKYRLHIFCDVIGYVKVDVITTVGVMDMVRVVVIVRVMV